ncbi:DgyrCDS3124 [Dimorphilus gyrociliatus]|uniref:DgyrCDS3124 n=1 Tax=Dimorphilus gyrociliatus TaxID=2664684 RepID=A0A7I8VCT6_9ANNE|nr:DgyrCDS3124 [Dimorphilus gyrociliatus]
MQRASQENLSASNRAYRRHSSFQGLGSEEQAVLDRICRRGSKSHHAANPSILVSEPSCQDFEGDLPFGGHRRASTQSMGPIVVPEPGRRDSRGRLLDAIPNQARRSSFQGLSESVMSFFVGGR